MDSEFLWRDAGGALKWLKSAKDTGLRQFQPYTNGNDSLETLQDDATMTLGPFVYQVSLLTNAQHQALIFSVNRKNDGQAPASNSSPQLRLIEKWESTQPYLDSKATMRILYDGGILILGNLKDAVFQQIRTIWRNANPITAELVSKNIIDGSNLDRAPINFEEFREEIQRIYNEETAKRAGATDVSQALTQTENSPVFVSTPDRENAAPAPVSPKTLATTLTARISNVSRQNSASIKKGSSATPAKPPQRVASSSSATRPNYYSPDSHEAEYGDEEEALDCYGDDDDRGKIANILNVASSIDHTTGPFAHRDDSGYMIPDVPNAESTAPPIEIQGLLSIFADGKKLNNHHLGVSANGIRIRGSDGGTEKNVHLQLDQVTAALDEQNPKCLILDAVCYWGSITEIAKHLFRLNMKAEAEATDLMMKIYELQFQWE